MTSGTQDHSPYVLEKDRGPVRWLTLNRPDRRNPLSLGMIEALTGALQDAFQDPSIRAIVLAAELPKTKPIDESGGYQHQQDGHRSRILSGQKPDNDGDYDYASADDRLPRSFSGLDFVNPLYTGE